MAAQTGIKNHVDVINELLLAVSRDLFSLHEFLVNSPMRVKVQFKEDDIDYDDNPSSSSEKKERDDGEVGTKTTPIDIKELFQKIAEALQGEEQPSAHRTPTADETSDTTGKKDNAEKEDRVSGPTVRGKNKRAKQNGI